MSTIVEEIIKEISSLPTHEGQRVNDLKTLESIEKLTDGIEDLNNTIKISNKHSEELEKSNYKLQIMMFFLAFVATGLTVISSSQTIIQIWSTSFPKLKIPDGWLLTITFSIFDIFIFGFAKLINKIFPEK
jgi:hypothetical protein